MKNVSITLGLAERQKLAQLAMGEGCTVSEMVRRLVRNAPVREDTVTVFKLQEKSGSVSVSQAVNATAFAA
ncbi:MAG: hypothetical protein R3C14_22725 [Caldilineaceae bacterium]